jgi:hypothetical protein
VYTSCVLRGALRFFNQFFLLIKKKHIMTRNFSQFQIAFPSPKQQTRAPKKLFSLCFSLLVEFIF